MSTLTTVALSVLLLAIALGSWYGVYEHVHTSPGQDARLADLEQRVAALEKRFAAHENHLAALVVFQFIWTAAVIGLVFWAICLCEDVHKLQKKHPV